MTNSIQDIILALDMGAAHVGIAVYRQNVGILPVKTIHYRNQHVLLVEITKLIGEYGVVRVVVGDMGLPKPPLYVQRLIDQIGKSGLIKVEIFSERLTSFNPKYGSNQKILLRDAGGDDHAQAAVNILTDYINYLQDQVTDERL